MARQWASGSTAGGGGGSNAAWPQAARVQELLQELAALSADGRKQPPAAVDAVNVDLGVCVRHIQFVYSWPVWSCGHPAQHFPLTFQLCVSITTEVGMELSQSVDPTSYTQIPAEVFECTICVCPNHGRLSHQHIECFIESYLRMSFWLGEHVAPAYTFWKLLPG